MKFTNPIIFFVLPGAISTSLGMLFFGSFMKPPEGPKDPVTANIINPQSAEDWSKRCELLVMNQKGEGLRILGKPKEIYVDKSTETEITQRAIAACDQAIKIDPQLVTAYQWRGNAKSSLGQLQAAILDYRHAQTLLRNQGKELEASTMDMQINNATSFHKQYGQQSKQ